MRISRSDCSYGGSQSDSRGCLETFIFYDDSGNTRAFVVLPFGIDNVTNIREKEGGTYGVGVQAGSSKEPYESYSMTMSFDCDPDKAEHLKSLIYAEMAFVNRFHNFVSSDEQTFHFSI